MKSSTSHCLEQLLRKVGYTNLRSTTDSRLVKPSYCEFQPDLILLDLMMPHLDGFAVMEQISQAVSPDDYLPILVLTADVKKFLLTVAETLD